MRTRRPLTRITAALMAAAFSALTSVPLGAQQEPPPAPASTAVDSPAAYRLTLEDAKQLALTNNTQIQLGRLNVREKQIAIRAAQTDYLPKILGSATFLHFNQNLGSVLSTPGVILPSQSISVAVANQNSSFGSIMVAQPITQLIGVSALVDIARADAAAAAAQLDKGASDLISGVTQAYFGLLAGQRIQSALLLQASMVEPLLKAHPSAELRLGLLDARTALAEVGKQTAELTDTLDQLLGLPPGTALELAPPTLPPVPVDSADEAARWATARNPEICEAAQNIAKARAGIKAARMDYIPTVSVIGGYANQNITDAVQPNIGFLGVTANYTLLDWGKRSCVLRQRETQMMMANKNVQATVEAIQLAARKAFLAFKQVEAQLQISNEVVLARQDAEKEAKEAAAMLTAKSATAKSQLDQMKAELDFYLAKIKLLAAIGEQ